MVITLEKIPSLILKFFPCQRGIFPQGSVRLNVIKRRALSTSPSSLSFTHLSCWMPGYLPESETTKKCVHSQLWGQRFKIKMSARLVPLRGSERIPFLAPGGSRPPRCSLAYSCSTPVSACLLLAFFSVSLCPRSFSWKDTLNPGWPNPKTFNLITSAKTLSLNKVTFPVTEG